MSKAKRVVYVRQVQLVPAETIWPGRCKPGDLVLVGLLASEHPVLGRSDGESIRTSLVVAQDLAARRIETLNTIYEVVP